MPLLASGGVARELAREAAERLGDLPALGQAANRARDDCPSAISSHVRRFAPSCCRSRARRALLMNQARRARSLS